MKTIALLFFIIFSAFPFTAEAAGLGFIFLSGGLNLPGEEIEATCAYGTFRTKTDAGLFLGGGIGYQLRDHLKLEGQVGYHTNKIDDVEMPVRSDIVGAKVTGGHGTLTSWSFLMNAWYDFPLGKRSAIHLGGGVGVHQISLKDFALVISPVVPNPTSWDLDYADDKAREAAFQMGLGFTHDVSETFILGLDYRYFGSSSAEFHDIDGNTFDYQSQSGNLLLSLRYLMR
jgi:opacity protein-like surface antigen